MRAIIEADPLTTALEEVAEELNTDHSVGVRYLEKIGKVKKLSKWVPCDLTKKKQTNIILKYSLILHNNEPFLDWTLTYDEKWILCSYWQ